MHIAVKLIAGKFIVHGFFSWRAAFVSLPYWIGDRVLCYVVFFLCLMAYVLD